MGLWKLFVVTVSASKQLPPSHKASKHSAALLRRHLQRHAAKLAVQRKQILAREDPEDVHQMRVTLRRLAAALRVIRGGRVKPSTDVRWLTRKLGPVRDLDVLILALGETAAERRYRSYLQGHRAMPKQKLNQALHSKRMQRVFCELEGLQHSLGQKNQRPGLDLQGVIINELQHVQRAGRRIGTDSPFERLHRLRIRCKRLRYQIEILDPKPATPLGKILQGLKRLLELLGTLQDTRVVVAHLLRYEDTLPPEHADHRAVERMLARQELRAEKIRQRFPREWRRFDKDLKRGLRELAK